ncbi:glycosyltransferase [Actinocorallia longicatena]|uniref:Glycosyltransferase n=2 Tax=Actinocorallia longicatena TaxID=111803 RepID=A0ABP6QDJ5_9ACTN
MTESTPRILHVTQPTTGGVAVYVAAVAADQLQRGWQVAVACPDAGWLPATLAARNISHLPWRAKRSPGSTILREAAELRRLIRRYRPDVVHLHSAKAGLAGRITRSAQPTIFQPHGWSWLAARGPLRALCVAWERAAARRADVVICVGAGEQWLGHDQKVDARYRVVRNGVDLNRFRPADDAARAAARRELGLSPDARIAVCVGRLTRQKGQDTLLAAWPQVRRACPGAELFLVGDGQWPGGAAQQDSFSGARLVPAVDDPRRWYECADVVVLPSRWEGLPLTALEALATGRSLVVTDVPGLTEVVAPEVGVRVQVDDVDGLASALSERLTDKSLADREGVAAGLAAGEFDVVASLGLLAGVTAGLLEGGTAVVREGLEIGAPGR